ncbi:MAG: preprotein translocase subunit SecD [Tatlockia sp.]|nr:preprotein translocase subunit SecD [Tatlockia sp.]
MNKLLRTITIIFGAAFFPIVIASSSTSIAKNTNKQQQLMVFQVIQSQMKFDSSTVSSATLDENDSNEAILHLKLKTIAASKLKELTDRNIGKQVNIILNGRVITSPVIQSSLGGEFLITGLTKEEAEVFIKSLSLRR